MDISGGQSGKGRLIGELFKISKPTYLGKQDMLGEGGGAGFHKRSRSQQSVPHLCTLSANTCSLSKNDWTWILHWILHFVVIMDMCRVEVRDRLCPCEILPSMSCY